MELTYAYPCIDHMCFCVLYVYPTMLFTCFCLDHTLSVSAWCCWFSAFRHVAWIEAAACLTNSPMVQGGTVKPALTQPWGLRGKPEHLIWVAWWPVGLVFLCLPKQACKHPGVLEYTVYFFFLLYCVCHKPGSYTYYIQALPSYSKCIRILTAG